MVISKSDREKAIVFTPGVLNINNPIIIYRKNGIRKKSKILLFSVLTLRKYKKAITVYRENIIISGFILKNDIIIVCNNKGDAPKSRLIFNWLLSFCTSKPAKKLGKKNESLY
jgi:hypothetical protein